MEAAWKKWWKLHGRSGSSCGGFGALEKWRVNFFALVGKKGLFKVISYGKKASKDSSFER